MAIQQFRTNLNCGRCVAAVKPHLDSDPQIRRWSVDTDNPNKILTIEGDGIQPRDVERHVADAGFRVLGAVDRPDHEAAATAAEEPRQSFWKTYRPLLLIVGYLLATVSIVEIRSAAFDGHRAMTTFMGGFFLTFSFFKLLDLRGFVDAFQSYDVAARRSRAYGYAYPFIELALGLAYLLQIAPLATNVVTLAVMLLGIIGVSQAIFQKRRIQCACLGSVFNLPMSKVTFLEDALMAAMAAMLLVQ